jgi:site-specific recombinase XerD
VEERGLARKTVIGRERTARLFFVEHSGRELHDLDAGDVNRFVTRQCRRLSVRSAERLVNGMRSFLRSALVEGLITAPLVSAVPSVARWSGAGLPLGLAPAQVAALSASCDRGRATGRRDFAIFVSTLEPFLGLVFVVTLTQPTPCTSKEPVLRRSSRLS